MAIGWKASWVRPPPRTWAYVLDVGLAGHDQRHRGLTGEEALAAFLERPAGLLGRAVHGEHAERA